MYFGSTLRPCRTTFLDDMSRPLGSLVLSTFFWGRMPYSCFALQRGGLGRLFGSFFLDVGSLGRTRCMGYGILQTLCLFTHIGRSPVGRFRITCDFLIFSPLLLMQFRRVPWRRPIRFDSGCAVCSVPWRLLDRVGFVRCRAVYMLQCGLM